MSENFKALIYVLLISSAVFYFFRAMVVYFFDIDAFKRYRRAWMVVTVIAFLSPTKWFYLFGVGCYANACAKRETNKLILFLILLFAVPIFTISIDGFGIVNNLFDMDHLRLISLSILLPAYWQLKRNSETVKFGRNISDRILLVYLVLITVLLSRDQSVTYFIKNAIYSFIDIFLPYYVVSRSLRDLDAFKKAIMAIILVAMIQAAIGIFEFLKHWLLYPPVASGMGVHWALGAYIIRDGVVRATGSAGQAIALGYFMAVAIGFNLYISKLLFSKQKYLMFSSLLLLLGGLLSPLSRGGWIGAAILLLLFIFTGRKVTKNIAIFILASAFGVLLASVLPGGEVIMNLLPFVGHTDSANVDYRTELLSHAIPVIQRNLLFGSLDFLKTPEMLEMSQGQGIIDIVNSYLWISLVFGMTGLVLFVSYFLSTLWGVWQSMKKLSDKDGELYLLGRVLIATILAMLVMIVSVSFITIIPVLFWMTSAMAVAYAHLALKQANETRNNLEVATSVDRDVIKGATRQAEKSPSMLRTKPKIGITSGETVKPQSLPQKSQLVIEDKGAPVVPGDQEAQSLGTVVAPVDSQGQLVPQEQPKRRKPRAKVAKKKSGRKKKENENI